MKSAKHFLEASPQDWVVLGAWLSPSHDGYVLPKCQSLKTPHVPSKGRCQLAELVVQAAVDAGAGTGVAGVAEGGGAEGEGAAAAAAEGGAWLHVGRWESAEFHRTWRDFPVVLGALGKAVDAAASKIVPIYVCGTDHAAKCGLGHGMREGEGVAIVQRAGERPAKASAANRVFAIPANPDPS